MILIILPGSWLNSLHTKMQGYPAAHCFGVNAEFTKFACARFDGSIYFGDLLKTGVINPAKIWDLSTEYFTKLRVEGDLILMKSSRRVTNREKDEYYSKDSLLILNASTKKFVKSIQFRAPIPAKNSVRSLVPAAVLTTDLNVYIDAVRTSDTSIIYSVKDAITDKVLRQYFWNNRAEYLPETYTPEMLHGGFICALSDDQRYLVEHAGRVIVHDLKNKTIHSSFTITHNIFKINSASFIDSNHIFISKNYNDGFILSLKDGNVKRLRQQTECLDTLTGNVMNYAIRDNFAIMGLQNFALSKDGSTLVTADYNTNTNCSPANEKRVHFRNLASNSNSASYKVTIPNYTNHMEFIGNSTDRFLMSNYLIVAAGEKTVPVELKIKDKRDVYQCFHPHYSPLTKSIHGVLSTIEKPGSQHILLANWDTTGKLKNYIKIEGTKNGFEYQEWITSSKMSADGRFLVYSSFNGMVRIIDLLTNKIVTAFEYGILSRQAGVVDKHDNVFDVAFSPDAERIAASGNDGRIMIWSVKNQRLMQTIDVDTRLVYSVSFSPDGKWILATCGDNSLRVFDIASQKLVFYFLAFSDNSYALINDEKYYFTNKQALTGLNFYSNGIVYDFSQFDIASNRPDKVMTSIGHSNSSIIKGYTRAYEKRLFYLGVNPKDVSGRQSLQAPELDIAGIDTLSSETTKNELKLTIRISDKSVRLDRLNILINGVPFYGSKGMDLKKLNATSADLAVNLILSNGKNQVSVSAMNQNGVESLVKSFQIRYNGPKIKPDLYVVAIGAAKYQNTARNLMYPSKDASDIIDLFKGNSRRFQNIIPILVKDQDVKLENIRAIKKELLKSKPDDEVIVFYAGHGTLNDSLDYYLGAYAMNFSAPEKAGIPYRELENLLNGIPSRNKLLLIDACFSGEIEKQYSDGISEIGLENSFDIMKQLFADLRKQTGAYIIAAAAGTERALESDKWNNGVFTYCFISGIREKKADLNQDGKIFLSELQEYVVSKVQELTNGKQKPTFRAENISNDLLIWDFTAN